MTGHGLEVLGRKKALELGEIDRDEQSSGSGARSKRLGCCQTQWVTDIQCELRARRPGCRWSGMESLTGGG